MKRNIKALILGLAIGMVLGYAGYSIATSVFPTNLDAFTDQTASDVITYGKWNNIQDAIESVQAKVGIDSSGVTTSLDYKVKNTSSVDPGHKHNLATGAQNVTASLSEINALASGGCVNADFVKLGEITATYTEINQLASGTAVQADFIKLHQVSASYGELNALDADSRAVGDLITESPAGTISAIAAVASGQYLKSAGTTTKPAYGDLHLVDTGTEIYYLDFSTSTTGSVTSLAFRPSIIIFFAYSDHEDNIWSVGFDNATAHYSLYERADRVMGRDTTRSVHLYYDASNYAYLNITSLDSNGFSWTSNVSSMNAYTLYLALP